VVEPDDGAGPIVLGPVDAHLAAAEELVSVTPGHVLRRRPSTHALAALARPVRPGLSHGLSAAAPLIRFTMAALHFDDVGSELGGDWDRLVREPHVGPQATEPLVLQVLDLFGSFGSA